MTISGSLKNARAMADNLEHRIPAGEQWIGHTQMAVAQAIRDLADAVETIRNEAADHLA